TISHSAPNVTHKIKTGRGNSRPASRESVRPLSREKLHGGRDSISCEIVVSSAMRSVISEAHVPGNDGFSFDSRGCGRGNSARLSSADSTYFTGSPAAFLALISLRASL